MTVCVDVCMCGVCTYVCVCADSMYACVCTVYVHVHVMFVCMYTAQQVCFGKISPSMPYAIELGNERVLVIT